MKIVIYSDILNQHQAPLADELWRLTGGDFRFVELTESDERKGSSDDFSTRPYLKQSWKDNDSYAEAMRLCQTAECCIFSGTNSLPFERNRMSKGLLSFDLGERWLKKGLKNFASPRLLKWLASYHFGGWNRKKLYKLCASAFCKTDHRKMLSFKGKCYKWGYFTKVIPNEMVTIAHKTEGPVKLMWCARFINWKHPETTVLSAKRLKERGLDFRLDMYGNGPELEKTARYINRLGLNDVITLKGNVDNTRIHEAMRSSDIFLITSDKNEGWGAVANESMSEGCVLVASDAIGSAPFLIEDGVNGFLFKSPKTNSSIAAPDNEAADLLTDILAGIIDDRERLKAVGKAARKTIDQLWTPSHAAQSLLNLIDDLKEGRETRAKAGPCSKA